MTGNCGKAIPESAAIADDDTMPYAFVGLCLRFNFFNLADMAFGNFLLYGKLFYRIYHSTSASAGDVEIDLPDKVFVKRFYLPDRSFQVILQRDHVLVEMGGVRIY
jgi:hypothetical protein